VTRRAAVIVESVSDATNHGALGIARSLGRLGAPIVWAHPGRRPPGAFSRYVNAAVEVAPVDRPDMLTEQLEALAARFGEAVLIPVDDGAAVFVSDRSDRLARSFLFPHQSADLARRLSDKRQLYRLCRQHGFATPESLFPMTEAEALDAGARLSFPLVLKRVAGWLPEQRTQMESVTIIESDDELRRAWSRYGAIDSSNVMLQRYIPGGAETIWMFNGYFDGSSDCLVGYTGKKLRQLPPGTGATTLGIAVRNDEVRRLATSFLATLGYRGIVDMGFRHDERDGSYNLLDVNPRIGSTFRLFVGGGEMDVARALYLDLTGEPVPRAPQVVPRKWLVEQHDLRAAASYMRARRLTVREWLHSFRGVQECAWFDRGDLKPLGAMLRQSAAKARRHGAATTP